MLCSDCPAFGYSQCPVDQRDIEDLCCMGSRFKLNVGKVPRITGLITPPPEETLEPHYFPMASRLDTLPFEIREQIAWNCSQRDAVRLCSTSTSLMYSTLPRLYSHVIFDNSPIHYCEELQPEGDGLLSKVTTIGGMRECLRSLQDPSKARLVKQLELRRVDIPDYDMILAAQIFLPHMTHLEKLVWTFTESRATVLRLLPNKPALKHLQVNKVNDLSAKFCNLQILETSEVSVLPPVDRLESLSLKMFGGGLAPLKGESLSSLKRLTISGREKPFDADEAKLLSRSVNTSQLTHLSLDICDDGFIKQLANQNFHNVQYLTLDITEDIDSISDGYRLINETQNPPPGLVSSVAAFLSHTNPLSLDLTLHWNSAAVQNRQHWSSYCGEVAGSLSRISHLRHLHLKCKEDDRGTLMIPYICLSYIVSNLSPHLEGLGISYPLLDTEYTYNRAFSHYGNGHTLLDLLQKLNVKYLDLLNCGPPPRACSLIGGGILADPGFEDGHHPDDYSRVIRSILPSIPSTLYVGIGSHVFDVRNHCRLPVVRDGLRDWFVARLLGVVDDK